MLINSRIGLSLFSILGMLALMAGATFAFFTDTATSNGNTFSTGTFDLQVGDKDETFKNNVTASTVIQGLVPGGDPQYSFICFRNNGSVPIEQILVTMASPNADNANNDLDVYTYVTSLELGQVADASSCTDAGDLGDDGLSNFTGDYNTRFDQGTFTGVSLREQLDQIAGDDDVNDDLLNGVAAIPQGAIVKLRTGWALHESAPTTNVAGKSVTIDTTFTATQNEGPITP